MRFPPKGERAPFSPTPKPLYPLPYPPPFPQTGGKQKGGKGGEKIYIYITYYIYNIYKYFGGAPLGGGGGGGTRFFLIFFFKKK